MVPLVPEPHHRRHHARHPGHDHQRDVALASSGLGLRPPAISWGVLLQQAQNIQAVAISPWLLLPAVPVIIVILAFNFLGDGLRDAADPYRRAICRVTRSANGADRHGAAPVSHRHDRRRVLNGPASFGPRPEDVLLPGRGHGQGGRRRQLRHPPRPDARDRRRERLRQERHRPLDPAHRRAAGPHRERARSGSAGRHGAGARRTWPGSTPTGAEMRADPRAATSASSSRSR